MILPTRSSLTYPSYLTYPSSLTCHHPLSGSLDSAISSHVLVRLKAMWIKISVLIQIQIQIQIRWSNDMIQFIRSNTEFQTNVEESICSDLGPVI